MSDRNDSPILPEVTFSTFVLSLASSALVHLGEVPNPETGGTTRNEALARLTRRVPRIYLQNGEAKAVGRF